MKRNKVLDWLVENKDQIGFAVSVIAYGAGMAIMGFYGHKLYTMYKSTDISIGKGGWVGITLGEDESVDIFGNDQCTMVISKECDLTNKLSLTNDFTGETLIFDPPSSGRYPMS